MMPQTRPTEISWFSYLHNVAALFLSHTTVAIVDVLNAINTHVITISGTKNATGNTAIIETIVCL